MSSLTDITAPSVSLSDYVVYFDWFWCNSTVWCDSGAWCGPITMDDYVSSTSSVSDISSTSTGLTDLAGVTNTLTDLIAT